MLKDKSVTYKAHQKDDINQHLRKFYFFYSSTSNSCSGNLFVFAVFSFETQSLFCIFVALLNIFFFLRATSASYSFKTLSNL